MKSISLELALELTADMIRAMSHEDRDKFFETLEVLDQRPSSIMRPR